MSAPANPFDEIARDAPSGASFAGEVLERKDGFFKKRVFQLLRPRQPIPLPVQGGIILGSQRVRVQGSVTGYRTGAGATVVDRLHPRNGPRPVPKTLADYIVHVIQREFGGQNIILGREGRGALAKFARESVLSEWGLDMDISVVEDRAPTVRTDVTVECLLLGWKKPVPVRHSVTLIVADPVVAASNDKRTEEQIRQWATETLREITVNELGSLTVGDVAKRFKTDIEPRIKEQITTRAKDELGHTVEIYTATPDIGVQELLDGFAVDVVSSYRTSDFHEATFSLRVTGVVRFKDLSDALTWLNPERQDVPLVQQARDAIGQHIRNEVQDVLNRTSTYDLCLELDGSLRDKILRVLAEELLRAPVYAQLRNANITRAEADKLSQFQSDIIRVCQGNALAIYGDKSPDEMLLTINYQCQVTGTRENFPTFFQMCYRSLKSAEEVRKKVHQALEDYANEQLQNHALALQGGAGFILGATPDALRNYLFVKALPAIRQKFGLDVTLGPLLKKRPRHLIEEEKILDDVYRKELEGRKRLVDAQINSITEDASPFTANAALDEAERQAEILRERLAKRRREVISFNLDSSTQALLSERVSAPAPHRIENKPEEVD